jgi:hypothetical protein
MPRLIKRKDNYFIRQGGLYYQDVELKAGIIVMNETNEVYAGRIIHRKIHNIPISSRGANEVQFYSI